MGVEMLDAPVSGGQVGAQNASLSIMVRGSAEVFEKIKPYFEIMGKNIVWSGERGRADLQGGQPDRRCAHHRGRRGSSTVCVEGWRRSGESAFRPLGGFAHSRILELHGERMIKRTFEPGFRVRLHQKDLNLALESARTMGLSLPNTATAQELFNCDRRRRGKRFGSLGVGPWLWKSWRTIPWPEGRTGSNWRANKAKEK